MFKKILMMSMMSITMVLGSGLEERFRQSIIQNPKEDCGQLAGQLMEEYEHAGVSTQDARKKVIGVRVGALVESLMERTDRLRIINNREDAGQYITVEQRMQLCSVETADISTSVTAEELRKLTRGSSTKTYYAPFFLAIRPEVVEITEQKTEQDRIGCLRGLLDRVIVKQMGEQNNFDFLREMLVDMFLRDLSLYCLGQAEFAVARVLMLLKEELLVKSVIPINVLVPKAVAGKYTKVKQHAAFMGAVYQNDKQYTTERAATGMDLLKHRAEISQLACNCLPNFETELETGEVYMCTSLRPVGHLYLNRWMVSRSEKTIESNMYPLYHVGKWSIMPTGAKVGKHRMEEWGLCELMRIIAPDLRGALRIGYELTTDVWNLITGGNADEIYDFVACKTRVSVGALKETDANRAKQFKYALAKLCNLLQPYEMDDQQFERIGNSSDKDAIMAIRKWYDNTNVVSEDIIHSLEAIPTLTDGLRNARHGGEVFALLYHWCTKVLDQAYNIDVSGLCSLTFGECYRVLQDREMYSGGEGALPMISKTMRKILTEYGVPVVEARDASVEAMTEAINGTIQNIDRKIRTSTSGVEISELDLMKRQLYWRIGLLENDDWRTS